MWNFGGIHIVPRNYALVVDTLFWTILAFICISLRIYTRWVIVKRVGWDDWLMTLAMAVSIVFTISVFFQLKSGLGQPLNSESLSSFLQALYITVILYNMTQLFYKLSIVAQSYRLFTTSSGKRAMEVLICWIIACGIGTVFASIFACIPVQKFWVVALKTGHCSDNAILNYTISSFNILNDLFLLSIPIPFLVKLQLPKKERIVLGSVFATGAITTIVSMIRLKALHTNVSGPAEQQIVNGVDIALWSGLEINVAIICGSVPALNALFLKIYRGTQTGSSSGYGYGKSRKSNHTQLRSLTDNTDNTDRMEITIQKDTELTVYDRELQDSQINLIGQNGFSKYNTNGNHANISVTHSVSIST
ncbi:putative integral membrane protein [Calycina marina]|uniref:Integral membrane protein n=1 Tax=Calycina marina TaxID=1763456 RepID=A0A9P7Z6Q0_9HELO|nr:putative integral membrane protein [Calycina marina]